MRAHTRTNLLRVGDLLDRSLHVGDVGQRDAPLERGRPAINATSSWLHGCPALGTCTRDCARRRVVPAAAPEVNCLGPSWVVPEGRQSFAKRHGAAAGFPWVL